MKREYFIKNAKWYPTHSKKEIENLINFEKEEYNLMAMIALGVSEDDVPNSPPRKDLKEVVTFIK